MTDLFRYPTIHSLAEYFAQGETEGPSFTLVQERVRKQKEALSRHKLA